MAVRPLRAGRLVSYAASTLSICLAGTAALADSVTIDFEEFDAGDIVSTVATSLGDVAVDGRRAQDANGGPNAAMIFDSDCSGSACSGGDPDLGVGKGKVLIVSEDLNAADPDDNARGGTLDFMFPTPVTVSSITIIDVESSADVVFRLTRSDGSMQDLGLADTGTPVPGDGGVAVVDFAAAGEAVNENVVSLEILLSSSGAIDDISFREEQVILAEDCLSPEGCGNEQISFFVENFNAPAPPPGTQVTLEPVSYLDPRFDPETGTCLPVELWVAGTEADRAEIPAGALSVGVGNGRELGIFPAGTCGDPEFVVVYVDFPFFDELLSEAVVNWQTETAEYGIENGRICVSAQDGIFGFPSEGYSGPLGAIADLFTNADAFYYQQNPENGQLPEGFFDQTVGCTNPNRGKSKVFSQVGIGMGDGCPVDPALSEENRALCEERLRHRGLDKAGRLLDTVKANRAAFESRRDFRRLKTLAFFIEIDYALGLYGLAEFKLERFRRVLSGAAFKPDVAPNEKAALDIQAEHFLWWLRNRLLLVTP